jgi:hypothetical protein
LIKIINIGRRINGRIFKDEESPIRSAEENIL